jgi:tetratricopeptide (TPR) repeat protein
MSFKHFLLLFITINLAACSSVTRNTTKIDEFKPQVGPLKTSQLDKSVKGIPTVEEQLDKLTNEALTAGAGAIQFLSGDLFVKAADASIRGDSQLSAILYKYILKLQPEDEFLKKKYSVELIRINKLVEAEKVLASVVKSEKYEDESIALILAGVYTALRKNEKARIVYERILKKHNKSEEACVFLSKSYSITKNYSKAMKLLNSCEKRIPGKAIFSYYKGKIEVSKRNKAQARKYFQKSLKINPAFHQAAMALGLLWEEKEEKVKAVKVYKAFLKKNPMNYAILTRVVQILFAQGKYLEVIPYAERLTSLDPSDLNLKVRLGILYTDVKKYQLAKGVFKEILAAIPTSDKVLYYLGSLHQQLGELDEAVETFGKIETSSTLFHDSNLQIAQMLQVTAQEGVKSRNETSVDKFISFVQNQSEKHEGLRLELRVMLAGFYENNKMIPEAIDEVESVRTEKKYNDQHQYYLASLYEKDSRFEESEKIVLEMLAKNPNNPHALNFLGYSLLERGIRLDQAFVYISKAVELRPEDGYIRDSLGWYYYKVGKLDKALVEIQKAFSLVKTDVVISQHLALIYQKLKSFSLAKKYYLEALRHCKVESERTEVLKGLEQLENLRLPASVEKKK